LQGKRYANEIHFSRIVSSLRLQCSFKKTKAKEESECVVSEIIEVRVQINHLPRFRANEISFEKKAHKVSLFVFFEYCQTDFKPVCIDDNQTRISLECLDSDDPTRSCVASHAPFTSMTHPLT